MKKVISGATAVALAVAGVLIAAPLTAYATEQGTPPEVCVPSDAWDEKVIDVPAQPAVDPIEEQSHTEYQRYSWVGGPIESAPESTPPGDDWQANTTDYEGAGHGTDPVGEAFQRDNPGKGNADWFFWTATKVVDVEAIPGKDAVAEVSHIVHHDAVICEPEHPQNVVCEPSAGPVGTNLNGLWINADTRSSGHYEYVDGGLHVWTDDNSSQAKVSLGTAASFALKDTGILDLGWTGSTPPPGVNLYVNFGADGNGTLVYESVYGQDLWLTNGSSAAVKANAPVVGGGNGSEFHGTIDQWLTKYPDAQVVGIAFSLGSGVLGDGMISSVTAGCKVYTFDFERVVPTQPEPLVTEGEWSEPVITCDTKVGDEQTITREVTITPYVFDEESWTWVLDTANAETLTENDVVVIEDGQLEGLECPVVTEPTPTATPTPTPTVTAVPSGLAATGGPEVLPWVGMGLIALLLGVTGVTVAAIRRR